MISNVRQSFTKGFLPLAWFLALGLVWISGKLMVEDYWTSYEAYKMIPTQKVGAEEILHIVAALPQALTVFLAYLLAQNFFTSPTSRRYISWMFWLSLGWDVFTDTYYKSNGFQDGIFSALTLMALAESLLLFTIGSEALFTLATGFVIAGFSSVLATILEWLGETWETVKDGVLSFLDSVGITADWNPFGGSDGGHGNNNKGGKGGGGGNYN